MPIAAVALALLSALIHASWNALLKSGSDRLADSALVAIGWLALASVLLAYFGLPPQETWPPLLLASVAHAFYWYALTKGYDTGDLSHVYTLSRGLAPAVVAVLAFMIARETPAPIALTGIALVCIGVLAVGASPNAPLRATLWALATAASIGAYSFFDAVGARATGNAAHYLCWSLIFSAAPILVFALWRRGVGGLARAFKLDWKRGLAAGIVSGVGYGVVLYAQTMGPVAQVTALRETSVVFAALIAWVFLRERLGPRRWAGAALVAAGAVLIAFSGPG